MKVSFDIAIVRKKNGKKSMKVRTRENNSLFSRELLCLARDRNLHLIFFLFHYIYQKISACVIMILILGLMRVHCEEKFHFEADREVPTHVLDSKSIFEVNWHF